MLGEHPVPAGPLAVRWLAHDVGPVQAGAVAHARVVVENAGSAPWRGLNISYHWLDDLGNPIVWDGIRHEVSAAPGERVERELEVEVAPRDASGARLFAPPDAEYNPELFRAAHAEGFAAVGGSLELRRRPEELEPYAPGGGRNPAFAHPLACPSLLPPLEPNDEVAGLPAWRPEGDEPWLYDARLRLRLRSGRRPG